MLVGEYVVIILDATGEQLAAVDRTATSGHPSIGEEITIDGRTYTVERVRHDEDLEGHSARVYTTAHVYVRIRAARKGERSPDAPRPRSGPVLPFTPPPPGTRLRSIILPPSLIAVIVACGYRAQATYFKAQHRVANRLLRDGDGWFLEQHTPADFWRWSRTAKRHCVEMQVAMADCEPAATSDPPSVELSPLRAHALRERSPSRPSGRPDLRLV